MDSSGGTHYLVIATDMAALKVWAQSMGLDYRQPWVTLARTPEQFVRADPRNTVIALGPGYANSRWFGSGPHVWLQRKITQESWKPKRGLSRALDGVSGFLGLAAVLASVGFLIMQGLGAMGVEVSTAWLMPWAMAVGFFGCFLLEQVVEWLEHRLVE